MSGSTSQALSLAVQIVIGLPLLIATVIGAVLFLVFKRRLGGLATTLGVFGSVLWVLGGIAAIAWKWFIFNAPEFISDGDLTFDSLSTMADVYGVVSNLMAAFGLALLIAAAVVRRPADRAAVQARPGTGPVAHQPYTAP